MRRNKNFKKYFSMILAFSVTCIGLVGCGKDDNFGGNMSINKGDSSNPIFYFIEDGKLESVNISDKTTVNKLQATDDFGRSIKYMDGYKEDKDRYVGLFYFTWHGWHGNQMKGIYDITKLMDENPDALWDTKSNEISPVGQYHYWGEPLYGYYNSQDPWVIRKQMELFSLAGIDFLAFDATNGFDYIEVVGKILPIMQEMYDAGWKVPKFMFYLNSNSREVIKRLYSGRETASENEIEKYGIYKNGYYKDLWFAPDGKPKIAAITRPDNSSGEGQGLQYVDDKEILDFFDFFESTWPNNTQWENGLPWIDWNRPQKVLGGKNGAINVSVAQHNKLPFSDALLSDELAENVYGRGYTSKNGADHLDESVNKGLNFEEEWEYAKQQDVKYTFVTGWNEWIAIKNSGTLGFNTQYPGVEKNRVFFVDTVNKEYSRDIELMKDGYKDNVYLALMRNVRDFKGKTGELKASTQNSIDLKKGLSQWNKVTDVYHNVSGEINRDYTNFARTGVYKDDSLQNDISEIRVTHDEDNIYFLVECKDDIKINVEKENWMNLMIDIDGVNDNSFYGYNYVINRISSYTGECSVEKLNYTNNNISFNQTGKADFSINGKYMQFKVSKKSLGIDGNFQINFKIADNVTNPTDIMSYYITGESAPVGRLNYIFKG